MDGFIAGWIAGATIGGIVGSLVVYAHFVDKRDEREALVSSLVAELDELTQAEAAYRSIHDVAGGDVNRTGRAWDRMKRAGDAARDTIWRYRRDLAEAATRGRRAAA